MITYKVFILFCLFSSLGWSQTPDKIKATEEEIRQEMLVISRQLGVTCSECHNIKNFTDDSKKSYKISLKHLKMVELLKMNGLSGTNGEPEASCYTCHRGRIKFPHKEPLTDHNKHEKNKKTPIKEKVEIVPN